MKTQHPINCFRLNATLTITGSNFPQLYHLFLHRLLHTINFYSHDILNWLRSDFFSTLLCLLRSRARSRKIKRWKPLEITEQLEVKCQISESTWGTNQLSDFITEQKSRQGDASRFRFRCWHGDDPTKTKLFLVFTSR